MAAIEQFFPAQARKAPRPKRWLLHVSISAINIILLYIVFPLSAIALANLCEQHGIGLSYIALAAPQESPLIILAAFLILDFSIYLQHIVFHKFNFLWKLHALHHTDTEVDFSTAIRFHPLEALISMAIKMIVIILIGAPALAVLIFEILLSSGAIFNHSNFSLPPALDRYLKYIIVTPDMHRIHHSKNPKEHHSNFGFFIAVWDHIFGTYTPEPASGKNKIDIGLKQEKAPTSLLGMLYHPFKKNKEKQP